MQLSVHNLKLFNILVSKGALAYITVSVLQCKCGSQPIYTHLN